HSHIINNAGGTITNEGQFNNNNTLENNGNFTNSGTLSNRLTSISEDKGIIINAGTFTNTPGSTFTTLGFEITNSAGGTFVNAGNMTLSPVASGGSDTLANAGTFNNTGVFEILFAGTAEVN